MKAVSRFEANLLYVLRYFLRRAPAAQAQPMIAKPLDVPPCLSRPAVELVQDTLAKGTMLLLAHARGWRRERFLRNGSVVEGRLWQRTKPEELGLTFTRHSLRFLIWITSTEMPAKPKTQPRAEDLAVGDWLLLYYAFATLRTTALAEGLAKLTWFSRNALCRLAFPGDFAEAAAETMPSFAPWTTGVGAAILEALQGELRDAWIDLEYAKPQTSAWRIVRGIGLAQEQVLESFLTAIDDAERRDLARFLLQAIGVILGSSDRPFGWIDDLDLGRERLTDRAETYRAILALPRQMERFRRWTEQSRSVGYFDEGYRAAQFWLAEWGVQEIKDRQPVQTLDAQTETIDEPAPSETAPAEPNPDDESDDDYDDEKPGDKQPIPAAAKVKEEPPAPPRVSWGEQLSQRAEAIVRHWEQWR